MTESKKCIFKNILKTCAEGYKPFSDKLLSEQRRGTILNSSKDRADGFEASFTNTHLDELHYHTSCYSSYTLQSKIEKYVNAKRKSEQIQPSSLTSPASKRLKSR